jgi:hypothetical protein
MRILVLTLMMIFMSYSAFGADETKAPDEPEIGEGAEVSECSICLNGIQHEDVDGFVINVNFFSPLLEDIKRENIYPFLTPSDMVSLVSVSKNPDRRLIIKQAVTTQLLEKTRYSCMFRTQVLMDPLYKVAIQSKLLKNCLDRNFNSGLDLFSENQFYDISFLAGEFKEDVHILTKFKTGELFPTVYVLFKTDQQLFDFVHSDILKKKVEEYFSISGFEIKKIDTQYGGSSSFDCSMLYWNFKCTKIQEDYLPKYKDVVAKFADGSAYSDLLYCPRLYSMCFIKPLIDKLKENPKLELALYELITNQIVCRSMGLSLQDRF